MPTWANIITADWISAVAALIVSVAGVWQWRRGKAIEKERAEATERLEEREREWDRMGELNASLNEEIARLSAGWRLDREELIAHRERQLREHALRVAHLAWDAYVVARLRRHDDIPDTAPPLTD